MNLASHLVDKTSRNTCRLFLLAMLPGTLLGVSALLAQKPANQEPVGESNLPRLPRDKLLVYRGSEGKPAPVQSIEDWAKRRAEVVRGMEAVMGKLPGEAKRCPLDLKIEEEVDCETYIRRLVTYASEPGSRVPAYLLIPKNVLAGKKKAPAILCLHGTDNVVGHGTVVGLGARPNRSYALELAQRGYVTLAPNYPLLAKYQPDLKKLGWESGTLKAVWDNMRGLDLLASLPYVDHTKGFGTIGHSLGGHNSVFTAVFDDRLKVIVSSCGLDSFLDYYEGDPKNWDAEKGWCQTRYMRKLAEYKGRLADIPFDFHELIGALAPRHVFLIAPTKDSNFRADSVDRIAAAARPIFKLRSQKDLEDRVIIVVEMEKGGPVITVQGTRVASSEVEAELRKVVRDTKKTKVVLDVNPTVPLSVTLPIQRDAAAVGLKDLESIVDENRLRVEHPDCEHDFPPEMREAAYKLFDAVLAEK